jgi:hypothetical protein
LSQPSLFSPEQAYTHCTPEERTRVSMSAHTLLFAVTRVLAVEASVQDRTISRPALTSVTRVVHT